MSTLLSGDRGNSKWFFKRLQRFYISPHVYGVDVDIIFFFKNKEFHLFLGPNQSYTLDTLVN